MFVGTSGTNTSSSPIYVPAIRVQNERSSTFAPWLTQNFTLGEYNLRGGNTFAVGLEGIALQSALESIDMSVAAQYNGVRYEYNLTTREWEEGVEDTSLNEPWEADEGHSPGWGSLT